MRFINFLSAALFLLFISACAKSGDEAVGDNSKSTEQSIMFPNYLVINAPSKDPDKQWYVSDYFRRTQQWDLETTDYSDLKLGMYELTQYPDQEPTPEQKDAADRLVQESFDVAVRNDWFSKEKGLSDGYAPMFGDPVHFVNTDYVFDGETLNPEKPEVLMYYRTREGDFLMGVMFLAIGQRGPQVAGPLTVWHFHIDRRMCYERGVLPIDRREEGGTCGSGIPNIRSPEMLHVWYFDHPDGKFATTMGLSEPVLNFGIGQIRDLQKERPAGGND